MRLDTRPSRDYFATRVGRRITSVLSAIARASVGGTVVRSAHRGPDVHTRALAINFLGKRSNAVVIAADLQGSPLDPVDRDIDAGALHVVLANRVGLRKTGVVIDREIDEKVCSVTGPVSSRAPRCR